MVSFIGGGEGASFSSAPAAGGTPALVFAATNAAGVATTFLRRDDQIAIFDTTAPTTQASADVAAVGTAAFAARRDHLHGMPTLAPSNISATGQVTTEETTTSTTYTDLATSGPAVTLTPGATSTQLIIVSSNMYNSGIGGRSFMSVAIAGAGASDTDAAYVQEPVANSFEIATRMTRASGVADGATHTAKYRVSAGTGGFGGDGSARRIIAFVLA